jgi:hypothetical protein
VRQDLTLLLRSSYVSLQLLLSRQVTYRAAAPCKWRSRCAVAAAEPEEAAAGAAASSPCAGVRGVAARQPQPAACKPAAPLLLLLTRPAASASARLHVSSHVLM